MQRVIQSNNRAICFKTTKQCSGWYPERCDVHALMLCEERGLLGPVCWDIGAHHGLYTILIASNPIVKDVYAFEPNENHYRIAAYNFTQNPNLLRGKRIHLYCRAAGNGGRVHFEGDEPKSDPGGEIETVRLSQVGAEPDFVKMDVEGFEEEALKGMPDIFRGRSNFYIELHPHLVSDYEFLWDYIDREKYEITQRGNELFGLRLV